MITKIFNGSLYHSDITNENTVTPPAVGVDWRTIKIVAGNYVPLSPAELAIALQTVKNTAITAINVNTNSLISQGFQYANPATPNTVFTYGLTQGDINNIANMMLNKMSITGAVQYPDEDDDHVEQITGDAEITAFYNAAFAKIMERKTSGAALRFQVAAMTTIADVENVIDDRT